VTHPSAGNIAGGGFAVVRTGAGKAVALDFREVAPAAATPDMYLDKDGKPTDGSLHGDRAVGVPGSVAGLWALHEKLGKKPWKELVAPAIALARDGFEVDEKLHESIASLAMPRATRSRFPSSPRCSSASPSTAPMASTRARPPRRSSPR
jgi:gamma-glutamyltranspeptidase/glutathione hydrolase